MDLRPFIKNKKIFFRIDDIGDWDVDRRYFYPLIKHFIFRGLPVNLQVIPLKLSQPSISFLKEMYSSHPDLIEIDQHGYSHDLREFCIETEFKEQKALILKGKEIIESAFGLSPTAFTPPEHIFSGNTIMALSDAGFRVFSKQVKCSWDGRFFYGIGRALQKYFLFGKKVSYHGSIVPKTKLVEISIAIESSKNNIIRDPDEIFMEIITASRFTDTIGILIHPICLIADEDMKRIFKVIDAIHLFRENVFTFNQLREVLLGGGITN